MPRLFVAIAPSASARAKIAAARPHPASGVRLVDVEQLHLTLHFIGTAETAPLVEALRTVSAQAFDLRIRDVGSFGSSRREATLWVGVEPSEDILKLHDAIGRALAGAGVELELRPYAPHITVARCTREAPAGVVRAFLERNAGFALEPEPVSSFALYSSTFVEGRPVYRAEAAIALGAHAA